jgi:hypothetical protein
VAALRRQDMKLHLPFGRYRSCAIITALLVASASTMQHAQTAPLRLLLACSQASELMFRFTIQNVSATPTAAVIGTILANDKKYLPARLKLTVRRAGAPDVNLTYVDTTVPGVFGRLDPWLVALPPDASYSVAVPARNFRLTPLLTKEPFSAPADLQLQLVTREVGETNRDMQGLSVIHVWVGTLTSEWVRFPSDCHPDR